MKTAMDIRVGNVIRVDGKICKVVESEVRGTGKSGKTMHLKLRNLEDGHMVEKSIRSEEKVDDLELRHAKMQYLYKDGGQFIFMNMESFEQFPISAVSVGKQEVFLKENMEIEVEFVEEKPVNILFPQTAELKVTHTSPGTKGGGDSTYKEAELENGLTILVPQFVKEGESIRVNVESLSYLERVTTKSLRSSQISTKKPDEES